LPRATKAIAERQKGEQMENMTAKEVLNLIDWLREQGFDNDKIVECIETVEGKKEKKTEKAD
jgi:hypothetical protein